MEWLKAILEKAKIEDGKLDIDGVMSTVNSEFPKHAVPKTVFNDKVKELSTANETIANLKKSNADNVELQNKIKGYESEIETLKTNALNTAKTYALKEQLSKAGVTDTDYLIYKQGGIDKFTFDKDGKPVGVDDILKPLREDKTYSHLFIEKGGAYTPKGGGNPTGKNPFSKETWNLTEQGKLLKSNPEQAKTLAAEAGITIQ